MGKGKFVILFSTTYALCEVTNEICAMYVLRHWLRSRETQLMVKGKGYMQTYWCEIRGNESSIADTSTILSTMEDDLEEGRVHKYNKSGSNAVEV